MRAFLAALFIGLLSFAVPASAHDYSHVRGAQVRSSSVTISHRQAPAIAQGLGYGFLHMMATAGEPVAEGLAPPFSMAAGVGRDIIGAGAAMVNATTHVALKTTMAAQNVAIGMVGTAIDTTARAVGTAFSTVGHLSAPCREARAKGGPCGCWAEEFFFHRNEHVIAANGHGDFNAWLADDWARVFPRVAPAPGTVALWPHRHVAPVIAVSADGMRATYADYFGTHEGSTRGVVFLRPI